jgi:hypothetical protein
MVAYFLKTTLPRPKLVRGKDAIESHYLLARNASLKYYVIFSSSLACSNVCMHQVLYYWRVYGAIKDPATHVDTSHSVIFNR